jgi:hypothetical protein
MPRYHMHYSDEHGSTLDKEGFEASGVSDAKLQGSRSAGQMIAEALNAGEQQVAFTLSLDDDFEHKVATMFVTANVLTVAEANNDAA